LSETHRNVSLCAHAIMGSDIFCVPDTMKDPRFASIPLVEEQKIRFYAGVPLAGPQDKMIGTLCIMDYVPRELTDDDKRLLKDLAAWAHSEMTSIHLLKKELAATRTLFTENEEVFFKFLDGLPVGVFVLNAEGKPYYANRASEQLLGSGIHPDADPSELPDQYHVYVEGTDREYPAHRLPVVRALRGISTEAEDLEIHRPDGIISVQVWANPIYDQHGRITHAIAAFQDITQRKRSAKRLATQYSVTLVLSQAGTLVEATPKILQAVCEAMGWAVGAIWKADVAAGSLHCIDTWHRPNEDFPDFTALTRRFNMPFGIGLPGRILEHGEPVWIPNIVEDSNFPRTPAALKNGLHAAFGFPIRFQSQVIGVLEFFSKQIQEPDKELLSMLDSLGLQVGQFIGRKQIEDLLEEAHERYQKLTEET